ncbi:hypothetical protein NWT39_11975 [Nitrososphaera viennensis]|uniref:Uncharacterized protein n=1 Tax=Nitrososphaera viennensis TaxID=1034015 RepID=A0A977NLD4_9ARCH|nr:hypothetical protein [Nitrososphaera viennensis]UVS68613.1 hypothetical protein NWT39_11975 [Nitrososphaera viennensis]
MRRAGLENLIYLYYYPSGMFEALFRQVIDPAAFPVWIPLAFGLIVGLAYAIASGMRRSK